MAHAQKPDLVFQRNGPVHLNRRGCQFSRLLAVEECGTADSDFIDRVPTYSARLLATHSIHIFPLHFPTRASPCAIRYRTRYTNTLDQAVSQPTRPQQWKHEATWTVLCVTYHNSKEMVHSVSLMRTAEGLWLSNAQYHCITFSFSSIWLVQYTAVYLLRRNPKWWFTLIYCTIVLKLQIRALDIIRRSLDTVLSPVL